MTNEIQIYQAQYNNFWGDMNAQRAFTDISSGEYFKFLSFSATNVSVHLQSECLLMCHRFG
jgi:hypothetical protein